MMGQIAVCLAAIVLALVFRSEASAYPAQVAQLPNLLGLIVMGLASIGIATAAFKLVRARRTAPAGAAPSPSVGGTGEEEEPPVGLAGIALGAGFIALIILYAWAMPIVGYLVATPLFLGICLAVLRPVGWVASIVTVVAVTGVVSGIFIGFLNLMLPLLPAF